MYQLEIRCFGLVEGFLPNPMMPSFNRQCRLPDSKVIRLALCSLPLNGDGKRLRLTNSLLLLHSAIFSCPWYFYFLQEWWWWWSGVASGYLVGRCHCCQYLRESTKAKPFTESTVQFVTCYCVMQQKDGQWKSSLRWDFIWLICSGLKSLKNNQC